MGAVEDRLNQAAEVLCRQVPARLVQPQAPDQRPVVVLHPVHRVLLERPVLVAPRELEERRALVVLQAQAVHQVQVERPGHRVHLDHPARQVLLVRPVMTMMTIVMMTRWAKVFTLVIHNQ